MIFYLVPAAAGGPAMLQPTQADANREAKERGLKVRAPDMEHEVPTVKADLMAYVNSLLSGRVTASMSDAITDTPPNDDPPEEVRKQAPLQPSYTEWSINIDETFERLPVAHQLHLAALAMENARAALP